jgi:hypothetical protein
MSDAPQWDGKIHRPAKPGKAFAGTPLMVLREGHRLNAIANVRLKGDTKKNGIESKSKSRLKGRNRIRPSS